MELHLPGSTREAIERMHSALGIEGLIELVPDRDGHLDVRRKTCCLAFILPEPRFCRGCCIK